ncbi:hypothetical protein AK812_SmicGene47575 [Symbiodinium microadriaticum]|uniref:Uncharacterized protein n=1 Tax=Symbiodinium microadriaticum TaxID=2951 RepID=A0A1Q9BRD8_SYMMI|nr:hypothetical protein AK812_SmicGene47575 [Symbiodinium microadriaticum]
MASFCSHTSLSSPAAFTGRAPLRTGPHGSAYLRGCIRWTGMLAVAAQRAVAYSLLELPLAAADECDGTQPPLGDLFVDARDTEPVPAPRPHSILPSYSWSSPDVLYVLTTRERAREARDTVVQAVQVLTSDGETNDPPNVASGSWAHASVIAPWAESRMLTERELLNQLPRLPDLQCAWLLLAMCASPRANHVLRTVPPLDIAGYAEAHDDAVWETLQACLGGVASGEADGARKVATLPASLGGLGLASAVRTAPAAYWAAWADSLSVLGERSPALAEACVRQLEGRDAERLAGVPVLASNRGWRPPTSGG